MLKNLLQRLETLIRPDRATHIAKEQGWQKRKGKISPFEFLYSTLGQASAMSTGSGTWMAAASGSGK